MKFGGRGGEVRIEKNRDLRYSVVGVGDGKWFSLLRFFGYFILFIRVFEEEKLVLCDRLNNSKFVFLSIVNRFFEIY